MTPAQLSAWIKARGLTNRAAAELLALSLRGLQGQLYGEYPVSRQTARIVRLIDERTEILRKLARSQKLETPL